MIPIDKAVDLWIELHRHVILQRADQIKKFGCSADTTVEQRLYGLLTERLLMEARINRFKIQKERAMNLDSSKFKAAMREAAKALRVELASQIKADIALHKANLTKRVPIKRKP